MEPAVEGLGLRRRTGLVQIHWMPRQNFGSLLLMNDIQFSSSSSSLNGIFLIGPKWSQCRPLSKRMLLSRNSQSVHHLAWQVQYLHSTADELCSTFCCCCCFLLLLLFCVCVVFCLFVFSFCLFVCLFVENYNMSHFTVWQSRQ